MIRPRLGRRGFTLAELVIGMVVAAMVAGGILRLLINENRSLAAFAEARGARATARSGINLLLSELGMVETGGGIEAAAGNGRRLTVRAPYAVGMVCRALSSQIVASLMPVDPDLWALPGFSGFAWKSGPSVPMAYLTAAGGGTLNEPGPVSSCVTASDTVEIFPNGRIVILNGTLPSVPPAGAPVMLYRRVRYEFKASVAFPGRTGLWRTVVDAPLPPGVTTPGEEVAAPFDNTARIRYFVLDDPTARNSPPADLSDLRGVEISLNAESAHVLGIGSRGYKQAGVAVAVMFANRPD